MPCVKLYRVPPPARRHAWRVVRLAARGLCRLALAYYRGGAR